MPRPVALSIAGSDSGGGAGIQADLRVFSRLKVFGTTVITAVTAQNLSGVDDVAGIPALSVRRQLQAVLSGFPVAAMKTGMLWNAEIVAAVAELAGRSGRPPLVVDPVMVATSGGLLLREDAVSSYRELLLPRATLVTPNLDEAAVLLGHSITHASELEEAAASLSRQLGCAVLLKGGHLPGDPVDLLWCAGKPHRFEHPRIGGLTSHGTGCMLSAAITAWLARGVALPEACAAAVELVAAALRAPVLLEGGLRLPGIENVPLTRGGRSRR